MSLIMLKGGLKNKCLGQERIRPPPPPLDFHNFQLKRMKGMVIFFYCQILSIHISIKLYILDMQGVLLEI